MHIIHACIRYLNSTTATKCGFLPSTQKQMKKRFQKEKRRSRRRDRCTPVVPGRRIMELGGI
jgi:hypothetical protein